MRLRVMVGTVLVVLGGLALPLSGRAQIPPRDPAAALPERAQELRREDPTAYRFSRAWKPVAERARQARREFSPRLSKLSAESSVSGSFTVPVFAVRFANTDSVLYPVSELEQVLFSPDPDSLTLRRYYDEVSGGRLDVSGQVRGWYELAQDDTFYEGTSQGLSPGDAHTGELIRETLLGQDASVDFGQFDNDGPDGIPNSGDDDGYVDFVAFVHPETGAECGGGSTNLWSHRWRYSAWPASSGMPYQTDDASANGGVILVEDYVLQPGLRCGGDARIEIGVFCHEFGHAFGLPDLYDVNGGGGNGIGHWCLMASGNWNRPDRPAHMSAWTKRELGWVQVVPVDWQETTLTLGPVSETETVYELSFHDERWRRRTDFALAGNASLALGLLPAEAAARGWVQPAGYGNGWTETVAHDFHYDGTGPVDFSYTYRVETESGFDLVFVILEVAGQTTSLAVYDGSATSVDQHEISALLGPDPVDYRLKFRFRSDVAYSDEDGNFASGGAPLVLDDLSVVGGGEDHHADFETHRDGWYEPRNPTDNPESESWLVENRQRRGFDLNLHGEGLLLYHVDQEVMDSFGGNTGGASDMRTRGVVVEEADGRGDLLDTVDGNRGDDGDPWPGSFAQTSFDSLSSPAAVDNSDHPRAAALQQITVLGDSVRVTFRAGDPAPAFFGLSPDSTVSDTTAVTVQLLGASHLQHGATVRLVRAGQADRVATQVQWLDHDRLSFVVDPASGASGDWDVVVENPDGQTAVLPSGFSIGGQVTASDPVPDRPRAVALAQNYPNPFNPSTTIRFDLSRPGPVRVVVHDLRGRRVRTLIQGELDAGYHQVRWDGRDDSGSSVASGVYLYRLEAEGRRLHRKMLLVE